MKILDQTNNLGNVLTEVKNKEVTIVSAFASKTEWIINTLLDNGNKVHLVIGTINNFSDPAFIEHCVHLAKKNKNLKFHVDFRIAQSIHWKLYLITPNKVIIGSANLTNIGVNLKRDTCVSIRNRELFSEYENKIKELTQLSKVISVDNQAFENELETYKSQHRRFQAYLSSNITVRNTLEEWLGSELNHQILLFIWDSDHTEIERKQGRHIFQDLMEEEANDNTPNLRDFFTDGNSPFNEGDSVLCMNSNGSYADFYTFDRIIYKDDIYWFFSFRQARYNRPFQITLSIEKKIKENVENWYEQEQISLNYQELTKLLP
jgi:hypothetical protein